MLDFEHIKQAYPDELWATPRYLLREYLQIQILSIIFSHPISQKLSFLGGTCLRLCYGLRRFSEGLDFDNDQLTPEEFTELSAYVEKELERLGYLVEIRLVTTQAFHCYIKLPHLLYEQGLSPLKGEKILIQLDTFDQQVPYESEPYLLNQFDVFNQIRVTPASTILAQKLWTITQRKRLKGRDFFDIFYLFQSTTPDMNFLAHKFGTDSWNEIVSQILAHLESADWDQLVTDVKPFLHNPQDANRIPFFPQFLKQTLQK